MTVEFAKDLVECDLLGGSDPFVSICLLENKKKEVKAQKVKSPMIKVDVNPIWNFQAYQLYGSLPPLGSTHTALRFPL